MIRAGNEQANIVSAELLKRLVKLGILEENSQLHHILALNVEHILARRLQTLVYEKGLCHTSKQARQFISHGHISIKGRKMTVPGYLVPILDEPSISYLSRSPLADEAHTMRPKDDYIEIRKRKEEKEKERITRMDSKGRRGGRRR